MNELSRRAALAAAFGAGVWATGALADDKDLQVEQAAPHRPGHRHPQVGQRESIQVSLTPIGSSTVKVGEPLRFRMASLADGFGQLYALSASGRTQLWLENVHVRAGSPLVFPKLGQFVRATAPGGDDLIVFIASRQPIRGFLGGAASHGAPFDLDFSHEEFKVALRKQFASTANEDWAVAQLMVRVVA